MIMVVVVCGLWVVGWWFVGCEVVVVSCGEMLVVVFWELGVVS